MLGKISTAVSSTLFQIRARARNFVMNSRYFGMPSFVQIEVTTKCNLVCKNCLRTSNPENQVNYDMDLSFFNSIISQLKYPTKSVHLVGLGEPLLNPQVFSMISSAKQRSFEVSLIDNFTLINRGTSLALINSGLDFLYISFDSASKSTFEELRTGSCFEKVIENVKLFVKTKKEVDAKKPVFLFKSTISKFNLNEIPQLVALAEDLGAEGINFGKMMSEEESSGKILQIRLDVKDLPESKITIYPCEMSPSYQCDTLSGCYVTFDGKVLPCGLIPEAASRSQYGQFQLGDLQTNTVDSVWRSTNYRQFRKKIASGEYLPMCKTCAGYKVLSRKS